ncbi:hypothetical protein Sjap_023598 [Stephania japonica]|uniref:Uncharacterized protein n=1 Tax=Stephania japonica TaxID=461633 RepID=A0AAP0HN47_9MAGN
MAIELQRNTANKLSKIDNFCAVLGGSPSFSSYSSTRLREIAAKVGTEFRDQVGKERLGIEIGRIANNNGKVLHSNCKEQNPIEAIQFSDGDQSKESGAEEAESDATTDDDFEFSCICSHHEVLTISAEEIFANGQIRPIYPIFDQDLATKNNNKENFIKVKKSGSSSSTSTSPTTTTNIKSRNPLRKLFNEERVSSSWTSSDFDDLESIPRETYCVWVPKTSYQTESSSSSSSSHSLTSTSDQCKKSSSTGTATRWKLRDLIRRSNSDGKDSIVFLARSNSCPKSKNVRVENDQISSEQQHHGQARRNAANAVAKNRVVSAHESLYVRNRASMEMARRQSFLPYRRDIVGFFANVNGLGKQFRPF